VAVEYDGAIHVGDQRRLEYDARRRRQLEDLGWRVITVTRADLITNPAGVVQSIRQALADRS
jgi:very-short-patch-repair endonuclease